MSTPASRPVVPVSPPHRGPGQSSGPSGNRSCVASTRASMPSPWPALGTQPLRGCESVKSQDARLQNWGDGFAVMDVCFRPEADGRSQLFRLYGRCTLCQFPHDMGFR
jgi:hypothetical protein